MTAPQPASRLSPEEFRQRALAIEAEVGQVIVGQRDLIRQTLITMLAGGNALLEGVPGLAKTTLVRTLLGLLPPFGGRLKWHTTLRRAYLAQRANLDELYPMSARDVVRMGTLRGISFLRPSPKALGVVEEALSRFQLEELASRRYRDLSEGQKQRMLFARLLAGDAEVAILDEPTSAMDKVAEREAFELIRKLQQSHGMAVLVVSHYLSIVREFADHALLLDADAQQVVVGTPAQVFEHATFRKRYGDSVPPSAEERRV